MVRLRSMAVLSTVALLLVRVAVGCDTPDVVHTPDASNANSEASSRTDATGDAGPSDWDAATEDDSGWAHMPGAPEDCEIDVLADERARPAPVEWQPCTSPIPAIVGCEQMKTDWPRSKLAGMEYIAPLARAGRGPKGETLLMFARGSGNYLYRMVAEADGAVRAVMREGIRPTVARCVLVPENVSGSHYAYVELENMVSDNAPRGHAGVVGELDGKSEFVFPVVNYSPYQAAFIAGADGVARLWGGLRLHLWSSLAGDAATFMGPTDEGSPGFIFSEGHAFFWTSGSTSWMRHKVWTPDAGSRDFLSLGDDVDQGVGDLGTDGKDLVWVEGQGRTSPADVFQTVIAKTAPFTTEPSQLAARTLRGDLDGRGFTTSPFVVGCGYAARASSSVPLTDGGTGPAMQIIRLADGASAELTSEAQSWYWTIPLAITCDHFISLGSKGEDARIARIPMTALGPWRVP